MWSACSATKVGPGRLPIDHSAENLEPRLRSQVGRRSGEAPCPSSALRAGSFLGLSVPAWESTGPLESWRMIVSAVQAFTEYVAAVTAADVAVVFIFMETPERKGRDLKLIGV